MSRPARETPKTARETLNRAMSEDQLLEAVTDALTRFRWLWTHQRRSDRALTMGSPGIPDVIAVRKDRLLFIELKTETGRLRPGQVQWSDALMTVGYYHGQPETWTLRPGGLDLFLESVA